MVAKLRQVYQEAWLITLAKVSHKKQMIRRTLLDIPQRIIPNFSQPLLLADFLLACLDDSHSLKN